MHKVLEALWSGWWIEFGLREGGKMMTTNPFALTWNVSGSGILKLYVKFWWPLFLSMKFTFLFRNFCPNSLFYSSMYRGGGGSTGLGNIPKKINSFGWLPLKSLYWYLHCFIINKCCNSAFSLCKFFVQKSGRVIFFDKFHHCHCCNVICCFSFADNFKWDLFLCNLKANEIFQAMTNLKGDFRTIEANASRSMVRVLTRRQLMVQDAGWPLCLPYSPQSVPSYSSPSPPSQTSTN